MPTPPASYRNRVMLTEAITRAFEVCDQKMACGSTDKHWVEPTVSQCGWESFLALGSVAGLLAFGLVSNEPGAEGVKLQLYVCGAAPGMGEKHFASASDCLPRASAAGAFVVQ